MGKQLLLSLLISAWLLLVLAVQIPAPAGAQEAAIDTPTLTSEPSATSTPEPTATPSSELTGLGWITPDSATPTPEITIFAVNPVDCATLRPPIVGYEISKGQQAGDAVDFLNDLQAHGFSLGTVNISAGPIPPCVDVLIVAGLAQNLSLATSYTAADGTLLQSWTSSGHGLMLLGDWGPFRAGTEALFQAYGFSQQGAAAVSDPTDFDAAGPPNPPATWAIYQSDNFTVHPILNGVTSLELLASSSLSPAANAIITTDADATPSAASVMAAFTNGQGCVTLTSDSNWILTFGGGYFKQNNALAARQMIQWLNGCTSLKLSKVAFPSPVQAGGLLTYTLTAINDAAAAVDNVIITDTVPASTSFVSDTGPFAGPNANGVVTWSLGTLNPNTSTGVTMVVQVDNLVPPGTIISNTAQITSTQTLSDTASAFTPVNVLIVDPLITKAANVSQAQPGDIVIFTLIAQQNPGSSGNATNVQIVDPLPAEVDVVGAQTTIGFATVGGRVITWTIPILTPTDQGSMTIQAQINNAGAPPLIVRNQANLSFAQGTNRLSNLVEIAVAGSPPTPTATQIPTPTPTTQPTSPPQQHQDDEPPPAPPTATPAAQIIPAISTALPVAFLPETGYQAASTELAQNWLILGFIALIVLLVRKL
ncbi:MAG: DUF11 domain-containing protein [Anaerolineae bacterium]